MSLRMLPNIEKLIDLYVNEKKSCGEICRMYGLSSSSRSNLSRILKKHGVKIRPDKGPLHNGWKGGKINKGSGYIGIWNPTHERADNQGYVYEHTLVYEKEKGYLPKNGEVLHHIDLDKKNNKIDNLYLCRHRQHAVIHRSIESLIKPLMDKNIIYFDEKEGKYKLNG